MVESRRVLGKDRIRSSTQKLSGRVPKNSRISVSTAKWQNPGEYREKDEYVRVLKSCPDEYRKNGRSSVSTEKWLNPGEYPEKVESVRVP